MKNKFLTSVSTAALVTLLAGCSSADAETTGEGDDLTTIRYAYYDTGGAAAISYLPQILADNEEIQEKHGIQLEAVPYKNPSAIYADLIQGNVDVVSTGPLVAAANAAQGAPISIIGTVATTSAGIISDGKPWTKEDLEGSRLAGFGQGTIEPVQSWIHENWDLEEGKDYEFLPAQSNADAVGQIAAGTADYAVAWEPHILASLQMFPELENVATSEDLTPEDHEAWQFVLVGNRDSFDEETAEKLRAAYTDAVEYLHDNTDEIDELAVENGAEAGLLKQSVEEERIDMRVLPVDEVKQDIMNDFEWLVNDGHLAEVPGEEIYTVD